MDFTMSSASSFSSSPCTGIFSCTSFDVPTHVSSCFVMIIFVVVVYFLKKGVLPSACCGCGCDCGISGFSPCLFCNASINSSFVML